MAYPKLFNAILRNGRMPNKWRKVTPIPIIKNKGDVLSCANYRSINLSHTTKLWERVIEHRLGNTTRVIKNWFGFMPGRFTMVAKTGLDLCPVDLQ